METTELTFRRARRPEHKEQRYQSILAAARTLGLRDGVRSVSLTDIGAEAGIAKSAVRRYFETREEIYLHLTAAGWRDWAGEMTAALGADSTSTPDPLTAGSSNTPDRVAAGSSNTPDRVAATLAQSLARRPLLCDLLGHTALNLERHVSIEVVRDYKLTALAAVDELTTAIVHALPELGRSGARDAVTGINALAAALWQSSHPPQTLGQLYAEDPRLAHAVVDFAPRLERLTRVLLLGLLATAPND